MAGHRGELSGRCTDCKLCIDCETWLPNSTLQKHAKDQRPHTKFHWCHCSSHNHLCSWKQPQAIWEDYELQIQSWQKEMKQCWMPRYHAKQGFQIQTRTLEDTANRDATGHCFIMFEKHGFYSNTRTCSMCTVKTR